MISYTGEEIILRIVIFIFVKNLVFFILNGTIRLYTEKGYPFTKYETGDMLGDSDTLLNVK